MTRYDALIEKGWEDLGVAHLLVSRTRETGSTDYAVFLVDLYCLGVKDAFFEADAPESALQDFITETLPADKQERIHPACAKKLIEGAVSYAESLGFAPARDFRKARKVLSGIDASLCPRDFTYGLEGRPCYIRGADDSDERADRVLGMLEVRCGPDGYDFIDEANDDSGDDPLDIREDLEAFLAAEPDGVARFPELSGLITALLICPTVLSLTKVFEALWGPDGRTWRDKNELGEFNRLLMAYWNQLNDLVQNAIRPGAHPDEQIMDVWAEDFSDSKDGTLELLASNVMWAKGFLRATTLWPEAWGDALRRPDLAPHWEVVGWWAGFETSGNSKRIADAAEADPSRTLNESVKALARALRHIPGKQTS